MAGQGDEIAQSSGSAGRRSASLSPSMESQMLQLYNAVHNPAVPDVAFDPQQQLGFQMPEGNPQAGSVGDDSIYSGAGSAEFFDYSGFLNDQGNFSPNTSGGLMPPAPPGDFQPLVDPTMFGTIDPQLLAYQAREIEQQNLEEANAQAAGGEMSVKLADLPIVRMPVQRRATQGLNMDRRCNVEAALALMSGQRPKKSCGCCASACGPWSECVIYPGQMLGACSNCWFNASGNRCSFQVNKDAKPEPDQDGEEGQEGQEGSQGQAASSSPPAAADAAQASGAPGTMVTSRTSTPASRRNSPGRAAATASPRPSVSISGIDPNNLRVPGDDLTHWRLAEATRRALRRGLDDPARMSDPASGNSIRRRLVARIESAAQELGARMAEFDDFALSPAGQAAERAHRDALREAAAARRDARGGSNNGGDNDSKTRGKN
ncbi:hypothetical protein CP532_1847 [Ophiocordyceps camponoti-leonardi (nom. inval.)]|nr:hypothetical protein CP532_1847 [Ophiocordyceps camponoti-leonardi (nom. inval.)]